MDEGRGGVEEEEEEKEREGFNGEGGEGIHGGALV